MLWYKNNRKTAEPVLSGKRYKVVFIGAGNVATHLSLAMKEAGIPIIQVYSHTKENARNLADRLNCLYTSNAEEIRKDADIYLFSVKDDVLQDIIRKIPENKGIWIHTAGSIPVAVFKGYANRYGVIYPMQTLSKSRKIEFHKVPLFIEGSTPASEKEIRQVAEMISGRVSVMNSEKRKYLHLAAVFACNFSNHMYNLATQLLEDQGIDRHVLQPLIEETANKLQTMRPDMAQTGPAIRYDRTIMERHLALLEDPGMREIYEIISADIHKKIIYHDPLRFEKD
ncbi:MAG: DUF2520 domain-containing protein [Tannerella sp.]|jgi:predicted short-subunit dehydrogenase-like oxidoreductase (DUF2520 family)|nr:DUF2520 domain-containing protein [Tannerella sp.]